MSNRSAKKQSDQKQSDQKQSAQMTVLTRICIENRLIGWLAVVLLGIPPALGFWGVQIADPLAAGWVPAEVIEELKEEQRRFNASSPLVLVLTCDDFFTSSRVAALHHTVDKLRSSAHVRSLTWAGDIPDVTLLGRRRDLLPNQPDFTAEELQTAKSNLLKQPLASENLISTDGRTLLLLIDAAESADQNSKIVTQSVSNLAVENLAPFGIDSKLTGTMALYAAQKQTLSVDNQRIQWLAYAIVGALLLVIFRRPIPIILAGSGPVVGVIWTMGWLNLTGQTHNELAKIILPVMVMMIGFTDGVHLITRFRQLRSVGRSAESAIRSSLIQTGPACFLTSLTTAIGFGSLMLSDSDMIAGFGLVSAIGVIVTFLAVILVSPLLAASGLGQKMHVSPHQERVTNIVTRLAGVVPFSTRHARTISTLGILITIAGIFACASLVPDDRVSDRVSKDSEAWQAMHHCDTHVGGIRSVHLLIHWQKEKSRSEIWPVIRQCESILSKEKLLSPPLSIRTALTVIRGKHRPDQSVLANQLPHEFRDRFYRPEEQTAFVTARTQDLGFASFDSMFERMNHAITDLNKKHTGFDVQLVSNVILEGRIVSQLIREMLQSLALAAVIIFVVLTIAFRSVRIGLISLVPNVMPLVAAGSIKYLVDGSIDIAGTCSLVICLGIAVDDTIHYVTHFLHERRNGSSIQQANHRTFITVGSALCLTTVVMTAGLGTVLTSHLPPLINFASMALITLLAALPADLLFLPAMLTRFAAHHSQTAACPESHEHHDEIPSDTRNFKVANETVI